MLPSGPCPSSLSLSLSLAASRCLSHSSARTLTLTLTLYRSRFLYLSLSLSFSVCLPPAITPSFLTISHHTTLSITRRRMWKLESAYVSIRQHTGKGKCGHENPSILLIYLYYSYIYITHIFILLIYLYYAYIYITPIFIILIYLYTHHLLIIFSRI